MALTASCRAGFSLPGRNRLFREPDRQTSPLAQRGVVLGPVRHLVPLFGNVVTASGMSLEGHGKYPTWRAQASYAIQLRLPNRLSVQQGDSHRL